MTTNLVFDLMIPVWPAVIFVAFVSTFMPDRYFRTRASPDVASACVRLLMWGVAILWFVPAYMTFAPSPDLKDFGAFWREVLMTFAHLRETLDGGMIPAIAAGYGAIGLAWAVSYFWIYARRLGQFYVMERDSWLAAHGAAAIENLSNAQKTLFTEEVLGRVKQTMLYDGDFPLRPLQQKRFFTANVCLWPLTLFCYLLGDLVVDVARSMWFAVRKWVHDRWVAGMTVYLADEKLCYDYAATVSLPARQVACKTSGGKFSQD